ncbi:hypothetical protein ER308_02020 [Egibacter rhizosphaerae]|uniref:Uncharacterized protein n=1 Tax=Egibacter rhizosphaerae TaxID=1670831 RepID=A0A411YBB8_9ACTN|nr:hypothetical protein [Egibacter rhizosphaerae]QBI18462.1 hypothetical protein ER308_02020 [Egibacter rhizosphaerae]
MDDQRAERLRAALALHEDGVAMMRQNLRRRCPDASAEEIDRRLAAWLRERPGAEHGDGSGTPVTLRINE